MYVYTLKHVGESKENIYISSMNVKALYILNITRVHMYKKGYNVKENRKKLSTFYYYYFLIVILLLSLGGSGSVERFAATALLCV